MDDCILRIEKLDNGYEVEIRDQKQAKKNRTSSIDKPYVDPWRSFAFKSTAEVVKFIEKNLDKAVPEDDFNSSFDTAVEEDDEEDD